METVVEVYVQRMMSIIEGMSAKTRAISLVWYNYHGRAIVALGAKHGYSASTACAIFASLSANTTLDGNWRLFKEFMETGTARTVPCALNGAVRASTLTGAAAIEAITLPGSKANKTKAFARSLLIGSGAVDHTIVGWVGCFDRWINRAVSGDDNVQTPPTPTQYALIHDAMVVVAAMLGVSIERAQAMVWGAIQDMLGRKWLVTDPLLSGVITPPMLRGGN